MVNMNFDLLIQSRPWEHTATDQTLGVLQILERCSKPWDCHAPPPPPSINYVV